MKFDINITLYVYLYVPKKKSQKRDHFCNEKAATHLDQ